MVAQKPFGGLGQLQRTRQHPEIDARGLGATFDGRQVGTGRDPHAVVILHAQQNLCPGPQVSVIVQYRTNALRDQMTKAAIKTCE